MRRSVILPAVVLSTLLLAGCTAESDDGNDTSDTESSTGADDTTDAGTSDAADEAVEDLQGAAGEDAEPIAVPEDLPVIATRATSDGSTPLEVDLNSVTATGEVMTVVFTARNMSDDDRWQISEFFDDRYGYAPLDEDGTRSDQHDTTLAFSTDGVVVLDPVNGRMHRAAYDAGGACVCNVGLAGTHVGPGEQIVLTTAFSAPPPEVTTVTVQIPGAGSFDGVPLHR